MSAPTSIRRLPIEASSQPEASLFQRRVALVLAATARHWGLRSSIGEALPGAGASCLCVRMPSSHCPDQAMCAA